MQQRTHRAGNRQAIHLDTTQRADRRAAIDRVHAEQLDDGLPRAGIDAYMNEPGKSGDGYFVAEAQQRSQRGVDDNGADDQHQRRRAPLRKRGPDIVRGGWGVDFLDGQHGSA